VKPEDVPDRPLLVDTDVFSYFYTGQRQYEAFQPLLQGHLLCMSFASYAEALCLGHQRRWGVARMNDLQQALRQYITLPYNSTVAEQWAPMYTKLNGHLHSNGINDLWTAACALTQPDPLPIVTNNIGDFKAIAQHFPITLVHPAE